MSLALLAPLVPFALLISAISCCAQGYVRRQGPRGMCVEKWKGPALYRGRQDIMLYTETMCVKEPREHNEGEGMLYTEACHATCSIQRHVHRGRPSL